MITIVQNPHQLSLAGNPVKYTVKGSRVYSTGSAPIDPIYLHHYSSITICRNLSFGEYIDFMVDGNRARLYCISDGPGTPNDTAGYIIIPTDSTVGATEVDILSALKEYDIFTSRFRIYSPPGNPLVIYLKGLRAARITIELINQPLNSVVSLNTYIQGGADYTADYCIHRMIYDITPNNQADDGIESNLVLVGDHYLSANEDGVVTNDVSSYLQGGLSIDIRYPIDDTESIGYIQTQMCKKYKLDFSERVGKTSYKIVESSPRYVIPGRMYGGKWYEMMRRGVDPCDGLIGGFLNSYPGTKKVYEDSIERLFFLAEFAGWYTLEVIFDNGDTYTPSVALENGMQVIEYDVSPAILKNKMKQICVKDFTSYVVRVSCFGTDTKTKDIKYELSDKPGCAEQFVFVSQYGALESFFLLGKKEMSYKFDRKTLSLPETESSYLAAGVRMDLDFKVSSGWVSRDVWVWLMELQRSLEVYHVQDGRLVPCVVSSEDTSYTSDNLCAHEFVFKPSFSDLKDLSENGNRHTYIFDNTFDNTFN